MTLPAPHALTAGLTNLKKMSISSLHDTLTSRLHSRDFAYARGEYLSNRVGVVGAIFLVLLPFWTLLDRVMLPAASLNATLAGRLVMLTALGLILLLARRGKGHLQPTRLAAGLLLATPACFYALVLSSLPAGEANSLAGYSFIPYMLVAMLAIFPFTLVESGLLGLALIGLQAYASYVSGSLISAEGLQAIWLLAALLTISLTANYFQLGLMLRLYRAATHDPLTGLLNRGALNQAVEQLALDAPDEPRTLLMMDLDHFKRINDTYGHACGDDVLRDFASVLRRSLRPADIAARYGGEEFVAVLPHANKETAMSIAEHIRTQAEAASVTSHEGNAVNYTVSIGVASFQPGEPFPSVAIRADNRLYEAKKISRNCVVGV